ncbi:hypothetical protein Hanom_Chr11g01041071 [Helianthus anomalus]
MVQTIQLGKSRVCETFGGAYIVAFIFLWSLAIVGVPFILILVIHGLIYVSHPNRWRNHRDMALSETDCPEVSTTTIITILFN